jgi:hypothetical protein
VKPESLKRRGAVLLVFHAISEAPGNLDWTRNFAYHFPLEKEKNQEEMEITKKNIKN